MNTLKQLLSKISEQLYKRDQSWNYDVIYKFTFDDKLGINRSIDLRFRVQIRRNAYNDQSWIRGSIMSPSHFCWNTLVERPIQTAFCEKESYLRDATMESFRKDALSVVKELEKLAV